MAPTFLTPDGRQHRPEPYAEVADDDAAGHVEETHPAGTIAHGLEGLVLETGKRSVSSKNSHYQKETPVGVRMQTLRKQRHEHANQKRAADVDDKRAKREPAAVLPHDPQSRRVAG